MGDRAAAAAFVSDIHSIDELKQRLIQFSCNLDLENFEDLFV